MDVGLTSWPTTGHNVLPWHSPDMTENNHEKYVRTGANCSSQKTLLSTVTTRLVYKGILNGDANYYYYRLFPQYFLYKKV